MKSANYTPTFFEMSLKLLTGQRSFPFLTEKWVRGFNWLSKFSVLLKSTNTDESERLFLTEDIPGIEKDTGLTNIQNTQFKKGIRILSSEPSDQFRLCQNYPNPFKGKTFINFQCPANSFISIKVYDENWNEIDTLVYDNIIPGTYQIEFDSSILTASQNGILGRNMKEGIYFCRMDTENFSDTIKMFIVEG